MKVQNLSKAYGELKVLEDISFNIESGEIISVIGESGCGKTTFLKIIAGIIKPDSGTVIGGGVKSEFFHTGFIFQDPVLLNWRTVAKNIVLPLELKGTHKKIRKETVNKILTLVSLPKEFWNSLPSQLSGGMQQKVSIARALVTDPDILLMDEPFSKLDALTRRRLNNMLLQIWEKSRKTIVFITHDIGEAIYLADRVVVLSRRPAEVKEIFNVRLRRPRVFGNHQFFDLFKKIEKCLGVGF